MALHGFVSCSNGIMIRKANLRAITETRSWYLQKQERFASVRAAYDWEQSRSAKLPAFKTSDDEANALPGASLEAPLPLTVKDLLAIILGEMPDAWVNEILLTLLGWRRADDEKWDNSNVPDEWRKPYPDSPPDFIGSPTNYSPAIDLPVKRAMQKLNRTIEPESKQQLKQILKPHGFKGWKINELTPNRTRRATAVNYILFWYKEHFPKYAWK